MDLKSRTVAVYARILPPGVKYPEISFGRVLTASDYRGKGLASEFMMVCMKTIEEHFPGSNIKISAQQYLKKFYQDFGFITVGDSYIEEGIQHISMLKTSLKGGEV